MSLSSTDVDVLIVVIIVGGDDRSAPPSLFVDEFVDSEKVQKNLPRSTK